MRLACAVLLSGLLLCPSSLHAASRPWNNAFDIDVVNEQALTEQESATLWRLLSQVPHRLYANLRTIHIDRVGYDPQDRTSINCWSGPTISEVCAHELGHQIDVAATDHLHTWAQELIAEAGCEPSHYLRSQFAPCFFVDAPQEFIASMVGEWLLDSRTMMERALGQAKLGNTHPMNQIILLLVLFGMRSTTGWDASFGASVLAWAPGWTTDRIVTPWQVWPWQCVGPHWVISPIEVWQMTLDPRCRFVWFP